MLTIDQIYQRSYDFLLENEIFSLPCKLLELCRRNRWNLISVQRFCENNRFDQKFMLRHVLRAPAAAILLKNPIRYAILYDESIPLPRRRMIICHEIGHIVLKHFEDYPTLNDAASSPPENYSAIEKEADLFAAFLLAPPHLLLKAPSNNISDLAALANAPEECIEISLAYSNRCAQLHSPFETNFEAIPMRDCPSTF